MHVDTCCADAIEFGSSFGRYSRINNRKFALLFDEKVNEEGFVYKIGQRNNKTNHFTVRIIRPKPEGILLALWKVGKISFRSVFSPGNPATIELKVN
nr:hypothetical protein CcurKRNrm1_p116 [Cryptomonas curvata]